LDELETVWLGETEPLNEADCVDEEDWDAHCDIVIECIAEFVR
jgi:hypothetical protein